MLRIFILLLIVVPQFLWSQGIENEEDLIEQANEYFEDASYMEALPLFSQLVSLHPRNSNYNYKFGACVVFSGVDKDTAIKHLTFATRKNESDPRAYYFLGLAKHKNYEFREAKKAYNEFLQKADEKLKAKFDAQRQIEMCTNGEGLLSNLTDLVVLDKKEVSEDGFFRFYELDEIGGKVIAKPEALITKNDKKKGLTGVVHFTAGSEFLYYSSYGKDGNQLDLYRVQPLSAGEFSKPELLKGTINTKYDEDFAFMHTDGETLYFASKGHSSMGGYDVFKATFNRGNDSYDQVENLDFAINTPDDDLFYLVDSTKTMAYFASGRSSAQKNLNVYKVRVESLPLDFVVLQGEFMAETATETKNTKITVYDEFTGLRVGEFYTDPNTGKYDIPLERAGTYRLNVESEGSEIIHEGIVEVPVYNKPVALRQNLLLTDASGAESLKISNYFDEPLETDMAELSQEILRRKASLEVNADEMTALLEAQKEQEAESLAEETAGRPLAEAGVAAGFGNDVTIEELASDMKTNAEQLEEQSSFLKARAEQAYAESQIKKQLAEEKLAQGKQLLASADESDPEQYINRTNEGNAILAESRELSMEAQSLLEVVKSVDTYAKELKETSEEMSINAFIVETGGDFDEVVEILSAEKQRQRDENKVSEVDPETVISKAAEFKSKELANLINRIDGLREQEADFNRKVKSKQKTLEATSKKSEKETLETEIQALENELITTTEDLEDESKKLKDIRYEAESYALQRDLLQNLNTLEYTFQGNGQSYDLAEIDAQITQIGESAEEAQSLIPENASAMAAASEEMKSRVELKTIQEKLKENGNTAQLISAEDLKTNMAAEKAKLAELVNSEEQNAKLNALERAYQSDLNDQLASLDQILKDQSLNADEKAFVESERAQLKSELNPISEVAIEFTKEEKAEIASTYALEESEALEGWREKQVDFTDLESGSLLANKLSEKLEEEIKLKNKEILVGTSAEEVEQLNEEVNQLIAAKKEADLLPFSPDYLAEIYEEQLKSSPERKLEISEEYRTVLEQKIIELDESSKGVSEAQQLENRTLKNLLSLELTTTSNRIQQIEETIASGEQTELTESSEQLADNAYSDETPENAEERSDEYSETSQSEETDSERSVLENVVDEVTTDVIDQSAQTENPVNDDNGHSESTSSDSSTNNSSAELIDAEIEDVTDTAESNEQTETETPEGSDTANSDTASNVTILDNSELDNVNTIVSEEQAQLNAEIAQRKAEGYVEIADAKDAAEAINLIRPDYATDRNKIDLELELSESEKLKETISLDEELINNFSEQIAKRVQRIDASENEALKDELQMEITALAFVKDQKKENVKMMQSSLNQIQVEEALVNNEETQAAPTAEHEAEEANIVDNSEFPGLSELPEESPGLSNQEIKEEIEALPKQVQQAFSDNVLASKEPELSEVKTNETYLDLVESTPSLSGAQKSQAEIIELRSYINELEASEPASSSEEKVRDKYLAKANKRLAKIESKESPKVLAAAAVNYDEVRNSVENKLETKSAELPAEHPVTKQVQQLRKEAEILNEDAEIYTDLAEGNKKNSTEQSQLYNEATAKQMAAIENLKKADWLLDNSSDLVALSPETMEKMIKDEELNVAVAAAKELAETEALAEAKKQNRNKNAEPLEPTFNDLLLQLDDDVSTPSQVQEQWVSMSSEEKEELRSSEVFTEYKTKSKVLDQNFVTLLGAESQINSNKVRARSKEREAAMLEESLPTLSSDEEKTETADQIQKLKASAELYYSKAEQLETERTELYEETLVLKSELQMMEKNMVSGDLANAEIAISPASPSSESSSSTDQTDQTETPDVNISQVASPSDTTSSETSETADNSSMENNEQPEETANSILPVPETEAPVVSEAELTKTRATAETIYSRSLDLSNIEEKSLFLTSKNVYNDERPIPVNVALPEGVVFKVQIGAFRNPIPQTLYNDFAPVMGEELTNGITRYTAGIFKEFSVANDAKSDIRTIGYSDAFVVAYNNGERISISEARRLASENQLADGNSSTSLSTTTESNSAESGSGQGSLADSSATENVTTASGTGENNLATTETTENSITANPSTGNNTVENSESENNETTNLPASSQGSETANGTTVNSESINETFAPTESSDDYYESFPDAAEANQIEVLKGLFYTVQIGVFSKPVPARDIYNISPLNSEKLDNTNIRYTTGVYNNLSEAVSRKTQIQNLGISDAFVTAYFNGKRITIANAKQKFQENGSEVLNVTNEVTDTPVSSPPVVSEPVAPKKDQYVVYIGTFTNEVPANVAKAMLFLEDSRGIVQKRNGNQVAYYTNPVNSEETAKIIKQEFESYEVFGVVVQKVGEE
ncbi:MAG: hypothetical protein AB8B53_01955 [Flavobacteriales bacterium]